MPAFVEESQQITMNGPSGQKGKGYNKRNSREKITEEIVVIGEMEVLQHKAIMLLLDVQLFANAVLFLVTKPVGIVLSDAGNILSLICVISYEEVQNVLVAF